MEKKPTIGFVSAPAYFDPAPSEFAALVEAVGVSAMYPKQRVRLPKFIKISITYLNYNEILHNGKLCAMEAFLIFVPILMISQLTNYPDSRDN